MDANTLIIYVVLREPSNCIDIDWKFLP